MYLRIAITAVVCVVSLGSGLAAAEKTGKISFRRTQLENKFRSEGVAVGDFNRDGRKDIAAGNVYFAAPDWKMHPILDNPKEYDPLQYSNSFCNWADDLNGDGWDDLIVVDFPGQQTWWLENPESAAGPWKRHVLTPVTNNESPTYLDVDGDGRRDLVLGYSTDPANPDGPDRWMGLARRASDPSAAWCSPPSRPRCARYAEIHARARRGDINRDGRNDVVVKDGWWEAPCRRMRPAMSGNFIRPASARICAQMHVYDFDGDGDNDVLTSSAHMIGIWWHEQTPEGWNTHTIERSFSQTHSLCLADINGDGLPDFVTGKRWWAHGPKGDANPDEPAVVFWFELGRKDGKPAWTPHQIDNDSGVGTQFEVADVNGDGLLDVVTSNKKGTNYFEQVRE